MHSYYCLESKELYLSARGFLKLKLQLVYFHSSVVNFISYILSAPYWDYFPYVIPMAVNRYVHILKLETILMFCSVVISVLHWFQWCEANQTTIKYYLCQAWFSWERPLYFLVWSLWTCALCLFQTSPLGDSTLFFYIKVTHTHG